MKRGRLPQLRHTAVRGSRLASSFRSLAPCVCWPRPHCPLFGFWRSWLPLCPTGARHPLFGLLWTAPAACAKQRRLARAQGRLVPGFPTGPGLSPPVGSVVVVPPRACCVSLVSLGGALLPRCRWALPLSSPVAVVCPGFGALRPRRFRCPSPLGTGFPAPRCGHKKPLRGSPSSSGTPQQLPVPCCRA